MVESSLSYSRTVLTVFKTTVWSPFSVSDGGLNKSHEGGCGFYNKSLLSTPESVLMR